MVSFVGSTKPLAIIIRWLVMFSRYNRHLYTRNSFFIVQVGKSSFIWLVTLEASLVHFCLASLVKCQHGRIFCLITGQAMNQWECVASTIQNVLCQSIRMHCVNQSEFVMSNYFGLIMLQFFNQLTFHGLLFLKLSQTFMSSHRIFNVTLSGLHMFFKNVFFPVDVCSETHNIRGL